jgi:hypothetical protein
LEENLKVRFLRGEVNSAVDQPKGCEDPLRRYFVNPKAGRIGYPGVGIYFNFPRLRFHPRFKILVKV